MISNNLILITFIFIISLGFIITFFVKEHKITVKYSIIWYGCLFLISLAIIFPKSLLFFSNIFGIQVVSNLFFALIIAFFMVILLSLTIIVSKQKEQIKLLIQEVSIINSKNINK